jgi:acyl transferase domain-containing protein
MMLLLTFQSMLNDDGKSYSFDSRGAGYGRGEGVTTLVVKRLDDALRQGDSIRAVIWNTAVNQDGKTNGITLPSQAAQQSLEQSIYQCAGLDPRDISYIEAHGTGTVAGDLAEIRAIANVFTQNGLRPDPLYVGSVKSNIGHLESSSGLAGLIKTVMVLEKGLIPPNVNIQAFKRDLRLEAWNIKVMFGILLIRIAN